MIDLLLIGAGGHARVVLAALLDVRVGLVDVVRPVGTIVDGAVVLGGDDIMASHAGPAHVAIGDNARRRAVIGRAGPRTWRAIVSSHAIALGAIEIGEGTFVGARAVLQPGARIGRHVIVNTGAIVEHDATIGDFAHIAPGSILAGGVSIGEGALVGAGAVVLPGISIGTDVVVGAGAVVVADLPDGVTVVGNPARQVEL